MINDVLTVEKLKLKSTKFFTNDGENTLLERFKGVFEHSQVSFFDALVGYFRSSGYFAIRPYLNDVPNIRILVGIDVDAIVAKYQSKGLLSRQMQTPPRKMF